MKYPIVIIYKRTSDKGRELKYALRSLSNLTNWDGMVFIVGDKEDWLQNVTVIPADKYPHRHSDVQSKYRTIANSKIIPNDFILTHDDIFVTRPTELKPLHQGRITAYEKSGSWYRAKLRTAEYLRSQGIENPLDYDIHVPMIMNRQKLAEIVPLHEDRNERDYLMTRTLYGNIHNIGGTEYKDVKSHANKLLDTEFCSTVMYTGELDALFTKKSPFEK